MRARSAVTLATVCVLTAGGPALAAAKPACLQVVDAAGDGTPAGVLPNSNAIDILSADLATGSRNLVAVVRLASVDPDPALTPGITYSFGWVAGGVPQAMTLVQYSDGSRVADFDPNTTFGVGNDNRAPLVRVDSATKTITWTISRKLNPVLGKKGTKFGTFTVDADPALNLATPSASPVKFSGTTSFVQGDEAVSGKSYVDLTRSCVKGV
jgi:hypothetical protein